MSVKRFVYKTVTKHCSKNLGLQQDTYNACSSGHLAGNTPLGESPISYALPVNYSEFRIINEVDKVYCTTYKRTWVENTYFVIYLYLVFVYLRII